MMIIIIIMHELIVAYYNYTSLQIRNDYIIIIYSVVIRGDPSEDAVLCTDDKTFELRIADTSNALLITPTLILPKDIGKSRSIVVCVCVREREREREREPLCGVTLERERQS
jgi:hypothetical protein